MPNSPFLACLEGNVSYHIENIISKMYDGTIEKYKADQNHHTLLSDTNNCLFIQSINAMIDHSTEKDGWFNSAFIIKKNVPNDDLNQKVNMIFYDEFVFFYNEGLIKYEDVRFIEEETFSEITTIYTTKLVSINNLIGVFE